ncbi:AAA family ATPase [Microbispora sp. NBRC 16548]|uniref:AAA family ATPase n=1 Tax=Microbispora sp. NBRC 16548 TaxID=3030994 RepID=UPI0024A4306C|nr:AAA family ATPase [Microbispora sp. NBRC 16548]GLX06758.1 hypothetical protein Misp03_36850 [Microbispora sp. NBRC 16548]
MPILRVTRGLPGSGKSTLAKKWVAKDPASRARVNRDDLRAMLHDGEYLGDATEDKVRTVRDAVITALLEAGVNVICDDTNLSRRVVDSLRVLAEQAGAGFEVCDLTHVPLEECIRRDSGRERSVGEEVIRGMHRQYLARAVQGAAARQPSSRRRPANRDRVEGHRI